MDVGDGLKSSLYDGTDDTSDVAANKRDQPEFAKRPFIAYFDLVEP